jgi:uncharacterized protein YceH (UPF0502 family)
MPTLREAWCYDLFMIELTPDECRVLGVLIEKEMTTPEQYPLSLNAIVNGASQKNNRDPVITMQENAAFDAVESLRAKSLVIRVDVPGQRVNKHRHNIREVMRLRAGDAAIIAELLLRGPQTLGELRGRASRMHPFESIEAVKEFLRALMERDEPLVKLLPPSPGSRAERYVQLLSPDLHPADAPASEAASHAAPSSNGPSLASRVDELESEVARLKDALRKLASAVGEADPLA